MKIVATYQTGFNLRFCTHKTCKKQGAQQVSRAALGAAKSWW